MNNTTDIISYECEEENRMWNTVHIRKALEN